MFKIADAKEDGLARMSCDHLIGSEGMAMHLRNLIIYEDRSIITCPFEDDNYKCGAECIKFQ